MRIPPDIKIINKDLSNLWKFELFDLMVNMRKGYDINFC